jgi:APA family basic amino acid/polyamine antiporter
VRVGAAVASVGVLLSLIVGVSRTVFAMAAERDLPSWLAAVHPKYQVPYRAELIIGVGVILLIAALDVREAIGFSSFTVLAYYSVTNAAALTLSPAERRWPRAIAALGFAGCLLLAVNLPAKAALSGVAVLGAGLAAYAVRRFAGRTSK